MGNNNSKIRVIAFDLDGVLVDAPNWHYQALNKALSIFGLTIHPDEHVRVYNGLPTKGKLEMLSKAKIMPLDLHDIIRIKKKDFTDLEILNNCRPEHSKIIMLERLQKTYKLACCSNAMKDSVIQMLTCAGIVKFFTEIIGNDEGFAPKPAPDIYLELFQRLNVKPEEVCVIEDAEYGVQAANEAGAMVIQVKNSKEVNSQLFIKHKLL